MQYEVVVERLTYYTIDAPDEAAAIDRVLQGEGEEVNQETVDARIVFVGPFQNRPLF